MTEPWTCRRKLADNNHASCPPTSATHLARNTSCHLIAKAIGVPLHPQVAKSDPVGSPRRNIYSYRARHWITCRKIGHVVAEWFSWRIDPTIRDPSNGLLDQADILVECTCADLKTASNELPCLKGNGLRKAINALNEPKSWRSDTSAGQQRPPSLGTCC